MKLNMLYKFIIAVTCAVVIFTLGFWIGYSNSKTTINVSGISSSTPGQVTANNTNSYSALININTADSEELELLPGIGPALAGSIIEYRTEHGNYEKIEDIMNVSGISLVVFRSIESLITV